MTTMADDTVYLMSEKNRKKTNQERLFCFTTAIVIISIVILSIVTLALAVTVFKPKSPGIHIQNVTVVGASPRITFSFAVELNVTINLEILVENPNHASFDHERGSSLLYYQDNQIGEADLAPGVMPAMGSAVIPCKLTLQAEDVTTNINLRRDIMAGEFVMHTKTSIAGRVTVLGIFRKWCVATSDCELRIGVPSMEVLQKVCKSKAKF